MIRDLIITALEWLIDHLCALLTWLDRDEEALRVATIQRARTEWGVKVDDDATVAETIEVVAQTMRWRVMPMGRA